MPGWPPYLNESGNLMLFIGITEVEAANCVPVVIDIAYKSAKKQSVFI